MRCGDHAGDRRGDVGVGQFELGQPCWRRGRSPGRSAIWSLSSALTSFCSASCLRAAVVALQLAHLRGGLRGLQARRGRGSRRTSTWPALHLLAFLGQHLQRHAGGLGDHLGFAAAPPAARCRCSWRRSARRAALATSTGTASGPFFSSLALASASPLPPLQADRASRPVQRQARQRGGNGAAVGSGRMESVPEGMRVYRRLYAGVVA